MTSGVPIVLYAAASTLLDGAATAPVLLGGRRGEGGEPPVVGLGRIGRTAAAGALAFLVKLPLWWALGVGPFGGIHLVYADLVVLLPALGALLLLAAALGKVRPTRTALGVAAAALALLPVGIYTSGIEPFRLRVESARLGPPAARAGHLPVRVGVISDIQTDRVTDHERRAVDLLMAQRPDVIVIPGDVFQGTERQFEATRSDLAELFGRLRAPGGVYLVLGDTDGDGAHLRPLAEAAGIRMLVDEEVTVGVGDRRVTIGGVALNYHGPAARALVDRLETAPGAEDLRLLVAHRPDVALGLRPDSRVDLTVAGHTHGGQIVVPGFGPPLTLSDVPRAVAAGGLHRLDGNAIYVSRGVGHERGQAPRMRFLCPPEVAVVEIGGAPGPARGLQHPAPEARPSPGAGTGGATPREAGRDGTRDDAPAG
jgi:predicted MPP superfamily phosphohydrolase